ncbi:MAG: hypothetical protein J5501_06090 [Ruminococcus sp.]|nr:hypothetical protein [Ruminococcus sp.]
MNKKQIIYTLRSADEASVERFMSEAAKKDEIFAKALKRAEKADGFTDVAVGAEQYDRRIRITHTASIAAASVLLVAGIGGLIHLMNANRLSPEEPFNDGNIAAVTAVSTDPAASETTAAADTKVTGQVTVIETVTETAETDTVTTASGTSSESNTDTTEKSSESHTEKTTAKNEGTSAAAEQPTAETTTEAAPATESAPTEPSESAEQLREKCIASVYNYDAFSAGFTLNRSENGGPLYRYCEGRIKLSNPTMTGEMFRKIFVSDGRFYCDERQFFLNDKYVFAGDFGDGGLIAKITKMSNELLPGSVTDRVYYNEYPGFLFIRGSAAGNASSWEITGERNDNGRRTVSVSGSYEDNGHYTFTADIDAETGICLAYDLYLRGEVLTESFRTSDQRFNSAAEAPMNIPSVREFLENNGYAERMIANFSDYQISDLN